MADRSWRRIGWLLGKGSADPPQGTSNGDPCGGCLYKYKVCSAEVGAAALRHHIGKLVTELHSSRWVSTRGEIIPLTHHGAENERA